MTFSIALILYPSIMARLSGSGFGKKWGIPWIPEALFAIPIGVSFGYAVFVFWGMWWAIPAAVLGSIWSYAFMQSGTWMFLRWESHSDPNTSRKGTLKPIIDKISAMFGFKLGDEGYSWVAASVKGFLIGLPIGGIPLAVLWPLSYEIGSHAKGRVERFGIDPHSVSETLSGAAAGLSIIVFLSFVHWVGEF